MKPRFDFCFLAVVIALSARAMTDVRADDPAPPVPATGPISVLSAGTVKGDGTTDDAAAVQAVLDANPGRMVVFPDRRPAGPVTPAADYFLGTSLVLRGNGQVLCGESDGWAGRVVLKFAPGVTGIIANPRECQGGGVVDLQLQGGEPWRGVVAAEAVLPEGFGGAAGASSADGIRIKANFFRVERCAIGYFGRHGINIGGDGTDPDAFGDSFTITGTHCFNNRGCGVHIQGGDANAGTTIQLRTSVNQLWGIYDRGFLSNTHISPGASANHWDGTPNKEATKVWEAAGEVATGGACKSSSNIGTVWIMPYAEADQPPCEYSFKDIVIGGANGAGVKGPHFFINTTSAGALLAPALPFVAMVNNADTTGYLDLRAGKTATQDVLVRTLDPSNQPLWTERKNADAWELWQGAGGTGRLRLHVPARGQITIDGAPAGSGTPGPPGRDGAPGPQGIPGPPGPAPPRPIVVRRQATIPKGQRTVTVLHGLGGPPDPGIDVFAGAIPVWLTGANGTAISFTSDVAAPPGGITFTYAAGRRP